MGVYFCTIPYCTRLFGVTFYNGETGCCYAVTSDEVVVYFLQTKRYRLFETF